MIIKTEEQLQKMKECIKLLQT